MSFENQKWSENAHKVISEDLKWIKFVGGEGEDAPRPSYRVCCRIQSLRRPQKILPKYYFAPSPNYSVFPLLCNSFKCTLCHTTSLTCYLLPTEKFYADPKKYALKLQLWIFKQRYLTYIAAMKHIVNTGESVYLQ